ncbi:hypothetical protein IW261DRAFT_243814 [Armillaria novae-zelandiae]|uniref:C2H2-type domain-containing protein n=1 Tax=Armillaria novae-zelandiae TaxID=153914 RepID=A0AA39TRM1_9AGAR|nr:hypothetical protein IW261DRAFT_243814 [Armillaria novae-zelandiae]
MSFQSGHSNAISQGRHASCNSEAVKSASCSPSGMRDTFPFVKPKPEPVPIGYRVIKLLSVLPDDWATTLNLDASYRFCYERIPIKDFRLQCPLPSCAKVIYGYELRKHLKVNHPGFSQGAKYRKVVCPECRTGEMEFGLFMGHVLRTHCGVSSRLCAYCGTEFTPEDDLTRHYIDSCRGLSPYRRQ